MTTTVTVTAHAAPPLACRVVKSRWNAEAEAWEQEGEPEQVPNYETRTYHVYDGFSVAVDEVNPSD